MKILIILFLMLLNLGSLYAKKLSTYGYCKEFPNRADNEAYSDISLSKESRKPDADWVCKYPKARETNDIPVNELRCSRQDAIECTPDAGGNGSGDNEVKRDQWYVMSGYTAEYPFIRCQCGCFTGDVKVLSTLGELPMSELSQIYNRPLRLFTPRDNSEEYLLTDILDRSNFIVGPEEKPVIHFDVDEGYSIDLTNAHPVWTEKGMRRAEELKEGDFLITKEDKKVKILKKYEYYLSSSEKVYNVNTDKESVGGNTIIANGLKMGDFKWQLSLSSSEERAKLLEKYAQE